MNGEEIDVPFFRQNGGFLGALRPLAESCHFEEMCSVPRPAPDAVPAPEAVAAQPLSVPAPENPNPILPPPSLRPTQEDSTGGGRHTADQSHHVPEVGGVVSGMGGARSSLSMLPLPVGGSSSRIGGTGAFASKSSLEQPDILQGQLRPAPKLNRIVIHEEAPLPQKPEPIMVIEPMVRIVKS